MQGLIVKHTELVAAELAARYANDPESEIETWLAIAQQREAMVVRLYAGSALERRLPAARPETAAILRVVEKTIGGIWAQESSHTTLMEALRIVDDERAAVLRSALGTMEGRVTDLATSTGPLGPLARWLVGLGRATGAAPEFTRYLAELDLRGFFEFSDELEQTANRGYLRILELIDLLAEGGVSLKYGLTERYEFAKTASEERFHRAVFQCLGGWLTPDGSELAPREPKEAVATLQKLAKETLALSRVERLPAELRSETTRSFRGEEELISDGGLGELFGEFSLGVRVRR
ncbi:MAG TPA: hypothetical protein VMI54_23085 [Polyangiaceae bacterium]|nr:hypothetical protein [Polyangiaceae bacterium]